jgi:hypothetical protein
MPRPKGRKPRKLVAFWADLPQIAALKEVQTRDGIPLSEQMRRAVDAWLESRGVSPVAVAIEPEKKAVKKKARSSAKSGRSIRLRE